MEKEQKETIKPKIEVQKSEIAKREEEILKFWKENKIFEKTLGETDKLATKGKISGIFGGTKKKEFVFYDGPPFATGEPHYGHLLAGTIKDAIPRYKTMRGFHVKRKWGWDCHGLPVENLVEKLIGLKSRKDIEEYGIEKFNDEARKSVLKYDQVWREIVPRFGRFVDMENHYKTMDPSYTETIWHIFKQLYDKKLAYEGFKSMHICPRCETTLANFEVTQGYKDINDLSVYVKFQIPNFKFQIKSKIQNPNEETEDKTYIIAWTTTPWTLPGNVALAVNPETSYVKIQNVKIKNQNDNSKLKIEENNCFIIAKSRVEGVFKDYEYKITQEFKGEKLIGKPYKPLFDYYSKDEKLENRKNGWKIVAADFVTTEDGTGVVHIAPAFGEDDLNLGKKEKLPFVQHVGIDGKFKPEVAEFASISVKPKGNPRETDEKVVKYLEDKNSVFSKENFNHSYPFCWRCETPLLNYASNSWFVDVPKIKNKIISANKKIHWIPKDIRDGRFGKWLEGSRDWAISRSRYWGASIPVWKCGKCKAIEVFGGVDELKKQTASKNKYFVIRHGQAENNVSSVISSSENDPIHLTEKGREQIEESGRLLKGEKIDVIISSPLLRTLETSAIVAEKIGFKKEDIIFNQRIKELNAGAFDKKTIKEYYGFFENFSEHFVKTPEGGENYSDIKKRMGDFIYDLDSKYSGKNILIVTHETPAWLLFSAVSGLDLQKTIEIRGGKDFIKNGEIMKLDFAKIPHNRNYELDLHRPFIDEIKLSCKCNGGEMKRMPDVFDCWFESGSMPYAENHYPFENLKTFNPKKDIGFPADFIAEGQDQTRGWFYSMIVLSVALFGKSSYKNVIVNGIILNDSGQKMSKHLKNFPDPIDVVNKYGADSVRYYMLASPVVRAEDIRFSEKGVEEVAKKVIGRLLNVLNFYKIYADSNRTYSEININNSINILDKWIIARLNETTIRITKSMEDYELDKATRPIADFVEDLSTWYLRRSRERIKGIMFLGSKKNAEMALTTMRYIFLEFSKIIAPFMPFLAEHLYKEVRGEKESVHLEEWPFTNKVNEDLLVEMAEVRADISLALEMRAKNNVNVRQPLGCYQTTSQIVASPPYNIIVMDEINVKKIIFGKKRELDMTMTPELKEEGQVREFIRATQELRKENKLSPSDKVALMIDTNDSGKKFVEKNKSEIMKTTSLKELAFSSVQKGEEIKIDLMAFKLQIQR
ncbi:MAG: class I tRNA ligase family protein [Candidatus Paceibacterota bacterium]